MELALARGVDAALVAAAAAAHPHEACGLLLGRDGVVREVVPTPNRAADPLRHFEIDPAMLIAAHRAARGGGPELVGYYHSHPTGAPEPSATDRAMAGGDGRVWAIVAGGRIGWFRDAGAAGFTALSTRTVAGYDAGKRA